MKENEFPRFYIGDLLKPEDREELIEQAHRDAKINESLMLSADNSKPSVRNR